MVGVAHAGDDIFKLDLPVAVSVNKQPVRLRPVEAEEHGVVYTGGVFGVALQKVNLNLKLFGVCPVVVPLAVGDVLAPRVREKHLLVYVYVLRVEVFGLIEGADDVRVFFGVLADDICGAVGGLVIVYKHLKGKVRFLRHKALKRAGDVLLLIVCGAEDGYHALIVFHKHTPSVEIMIIQYIIVLLLPAVNK